MYVVYIRKGVGDASSGLAAGFVLQPRLFKNYMNYQILDPEVQKTYFRAKEILDSQGFTQQLGIYLFLGRENQPQSYHLMGFLFELARPIVIFCFIGGIILIFLKKFLIGISIVIIGIVIAQFFGKEMQRIEQEYFSNSPAIDSASQKVGSHKLMKIVADEMSKGSSMEAIVETLKKEIEDTLRAK